MDADELVTFEIDIPASVWAAMRMIGLEEDELKAEFKRAASVDLFKRKLLSIGKAAELAGLSLAEFMDTLNQEDIPVASYSLDDLDSDLKAFRLPET